MIQNNKAFDKKGFTITELMVVIVVMSILMAVAIPTFLGIRRRADASACRTNLEIIDGALGTWAVDNSPGPDQDVLVSDINPYMHDGFDSLEEPNGGRYAQDAGTGNPDDDIVVTTDDDGNIPDPTCSTGPNGPNGVDDGGHYDDHHL